MANATKTVDAGTSNPAFFLNVANEAWAQFLGKRQAEAFIHGQDLERRGRSPMHHIMDMSCGRGGAFDGPDILVPKNSIKALLDPHGSFGAWRVAGFCHDAGETLTELVSKAVSTVSKANGIAIAPKSGIGGVLALDDHPLARAMRVAMGMPKLTGSAYTCLQVLAVADAVRFPDALVAVPAQLEPLPALPEGARTALRAFANTTEGALAQALLAALGAPVAAAETCESIGDDVALVAALGTLDAQDLRETAARVARMAGGVFVPPHWTSTHLASIAKTRGPQTPEDTKRTTHDVCWALGVDPAARQPVGALDPQAIAAAIDALPDAERSALLKAAITKHL